MARKVSKEEVQLVHKAVEIEMKRVDSGEVKTFSYEEVMRKLGLKP